LGAAEGADDRLFAEAAAMALDPVLSTGAMLASGREVGDDGRVGDGEEEEGGAGYLTDRVLGALAEPDDDPTPPAPSAAAPALTVAVDEAAAEAGGVERRARTQSQSQSPHTPPSPSSDHAPSPVPAAPPVLAARDFRVTFPSRPLGLTLARAPSGAAQVARALLSFPR
jgi:hypothetical protein